MRTIIIGAGGHGQVVADILLSRLKVDSGAPQPTGFLDDDPALEQCKFLGIRVLGTVNQLSTIPHDAVIVAIGDNHTRQIIYQRLHTEKEQFVNAIHPSAVIGAEVSLGEGIMICAGVIVNPGGCIGSNVILNTGSTVDHHNRIGDHVHIGPGVHLGGDVEIGEGTLIGIGAILMPQCRVGIWSIVGAGAVVTKDVPDRKTAIGTPARVVT